MRSFVSASLASESMDILFWLQPHAGSKCAETPLPAPLATVQRNVRMFQLLAAARAITWERTGANAGPNVQKLAFEWHGAFSALRSMKRQLRPLPSG
jgi:hypothetical protein